jgi:DNA (cytosine-5)-methyltransferase 1
MLTLSAYKAVAPSQDVRLHKAALPGGFAARTFDTSTTVPFLERHSLPYSVESHWLSQVFSYAEKLDRAARLDTRPKEAGPLVVEIIEMLEDPGASTAAADVVEALVTGLVYVRNRGKIDLIRPKGLAVGQVTSLLNRHFTRGYAKNAPRLPQLSVYALYECMMPSIARYEAFELQPLERMKAANRKSGSVGDVDLHYLGKAIEAVEVKLGVPVAPAQVREAMAKVRTASVERYLILSTAGVDPTSAPEVKELCSECLRDRHCEIIADDLLQTLGYCMRLLRSTNDFVAAYATHVEVDLDLGYEHRIAWNEICQQVETDS